MPLPGWQHPLAIEAAVAENNGQLAKSLYQEAVRAEESLQQQEQFYANLALQYGKSMMSFAKSAGSGKSRVEQFPKRYPNAMVNIVSGNPNYGEANAKGEKGLKNWKYRKD